MKQQQSKQRLHSHIQQWRMCPASLLRHPRCDAMNSVHVLMLVGKVYCVKCWWPRSVNGTRAVSRISTCIYWENLLARWKLSQPSVHCFGDVMSPWLQWISHLVRYAPLCALQANVCYPFTHNFHLPITSHLLYWTHAWGGHPVHVSSYFLQHTCGIGLGWLTKEVW